MAETTLRLDGQQLVKLCKETLPSQPAGSDAGEDRQLLANIQKMVPEAAVQLARVGDEWYRLGGIVNREGRRVADNLIEWAERTYIECGKDLQALLEHAQEQQLIATRQVGNTLHFVVQTGDRAEEFIQIDIDKTAELADRLLASTEFPPEDLEDFIDPLQAECVPAFPVGAPRYSYRRKTDVAVFMEEIQKHHLEGHPAIRFMEDWDRSSAGQHAAFCHDWVIRPYQHTGRYGEQVVNVDIVNNGQKSSPAMDSAIGQKGLALSHQLTRFDRQIGYPFAWFFYMVSNKSVPLECGVAVYKDIIGDFSYLPDRDVAVLKDWIKEPYKV